MALRLTLLHMVFELSLLGHAHGESYVLYHYGANPLDFLRLSALLLHRIGCGSNCVSYLVDTSFCVSYFCLRTAFLGGACSSH
jgi:hypothetical protein